MFGEKYKANEKFQDFTILRYCGGGGYGDVYICRDMTDKLMALKIVNKSVLGCSWQRELKGVRAYRNVADGDPGLMQLYHVGETPDLFYYTMEMADPSPHAEKGEYVADTLAERLTDGPVPMGQLLEQLRELLGNVRLLHRMGLAHRDIKPENILFIRGKLKLGDIGLLSPVAGVMTSVAGTLEYLPPEQRVGETKSDSSRSRQENDLYAVGKVIYCCLTGNGANEFPSVPQDMRFSLAQKFLFRLSLQLCEVSPRWRLNQLDKIVRELARIQKIYTKGNGLRRGWSWQWECVVLAWNGCCHAALTHFWTLLLILLVLFAVLQPFILYVAQDSTFVRNLFELGDTIRGVDMDAQMKEAARKMQEDMEEMGEIKIAPPDMFWGVATEDAQKQNKKHADAEKRPLEESLPQSAEKDRQKSSEASRTEGESPSQKKAGNSLFAEPLPAPKWK